MLQLNTFLPFVQFSVGPWVYNSTVQTVCRQFMDLRQNYTNLLVSLAQESTRSGSPIVRPMWWIAPTEDAALVADQQFMLGEGNYLYLIYVQSGTRIFGISGMKLISISRVFFGLSGFLVPYNNGIERSPQKSKTYLQTAVADYPHRRISTFS